MKITDLNDCCLKHIFKYLKQRDLLFIGISNKRFQTIAGIVFQREHDELNIVVSAEKLELELDLITKLRITQTELHKLLLAFGNSISSIKINESDSLNLSRRERNKQQELFLQTFDEISMHSFKNLVRFTALHMPKDCFRNFTKPLPNVECVDFFNCQLSDDPRLLCYIFPKLNELIIRNYSKDIDIHQITTHFPYLRTLKLQTRGQLGNSSKIELLLNLNPQLTKLALWDLSCWYIDWKLIECIANMHLEEFDLKNGPITLPTFISKLHPKLHWQLHFKTIKRFEYGESKGFFPFTFDQLEKLEIVHLHSSNQLDEIIEQNEKLNEISLHINKKNWNSIIMSTELLKVPKIEFNMLLNLGEVKTDDIVKFLNGKSSPTNITFIFCEHNIGAFLEGMNLEFDGENSFEKYLRNKIDRSKWNVAMSGTGLFSSVILKPNIDIC